VTANAPSITESAIPRSGSPAFAPTPVVGTGGQAAVGLTRCDQDTRSWTTQRVEAGNVSTVAIAFP
jgi:hypothetical protein